MGLIQLTPDFHHFKASLLECPQHLKSIYFPADFSVTKVAPDSTYFPTSPWQWLYESCVFMGENSEQCDCHWLTSHLLFILFPLGASNQSLEHVSVRFPQRMGWPYSELSPVTRTTKTSAPNLSASMLGTGPAHSRFSNMLISVAAFVEITSLGSWPQNTLFIVD